MNHERLISLGVVIIFLLWLVADYLLASGKSPKVFRNRGLGSDDNYQYGRNINGKD